MVLWYKYHMDTLEEYFDKHVEPFRLDEKEKVVRVRDGKKETVYVAKDGYRMDHGREVKMSGKEKMARKRGQKVAQRKRNTKMKQIQKRIEKSKHKAETLGLDIGRPEE